LRIQVFYWKIKENGPGAIPNTFIDCGEGDFWGIPELEYPNMYKVHNKYESKQTSQIKKKCFQLCNPSYTDIVEPDDRDKNLSVPDHSSMSDYIKRHFPGLESTPSIVETCMYTVRSNSIIN
jgi:sarcosine oxidase / L-pipecolate oxidase